MFSFIPGTSLIRGTQNNLRAEVAVTEDCFRTGSMTSEQAYLQMAIKMTGLAIENLKKAYSFQHLNAKRNTEVGFLLLLII